MHTNIFLSYIKLLYMAFFFLFYCFYITKFKYHLCYYLNLFAILAKGTVRLTHSDIIAHGSHRLHGFFGLRNVL